MRRSEEGSAIPLVVVLFTIAATFIVVAAAATAVHLERLRLLTIADGAALAGAESFRVADATVQGDEVVPALDGGRVAEAVGAYLGGVEAPELDGLHVVSAGVAGGRNAQVTVAATWHPPIASDLLPVTVPIQVTSTATARFR